MFQASRNVLIRKRLYILVADNAQARLLKATTPVRELEEIGTFEHEAGRRKDSELYTDRPGGNHANSSAYHTYAREREDPDEERFARKLAEVLGKARHAGKFDGLVLIAAPHFLGTLRRYLGKECQEAVLASVDKDLVHRNDEAIIQQINL